MQAYAMEIRGTIRGKQLISDACTGIDGNALMYHYCGNFHSSLNYVLLMRVKTLNMLLNVPEHMYYNVISINHVLHIFFSVSRLRGPL